MAEVAVEAVDDDQMINSSVSNDTPSHLPGSPKSGAKKPRARAISESSITSPINKIAKMTPRATRSSQNPDFAAKQRKFLNRVHDPIRRDNSDSENSQELITTPTTSKMKENKPKAADRKSAGDLKRKFEKESPQQHKKFGEIDEEGLSKKRKTKEPTKVVGGVDSYCWRCHRDGSVIPCEICPRVYHLKCVQMEVAPPKGWMCPECSTVTQAENTDTRSRAMRMLSLDQFCSLLRYTLTRMQNYEGSDDFAKPVDVTAFPQYRDFIVKPMDLTQLKQNIKAKMYGSTEAFLADAKWIVHNSIIFNSVQSKFTNTARALLKICRQEMQEIENCPDCYQNAHTRPSNSWFIEACRRPHILVWAKLKGFPFWPAKAMTTNNENLVDVRFFGAHDRAWVPLNSCFLYSKLPPVPSSNKSKRNLEECLAELEQHIKKLRDKFGPFEYPPYKTPYDPKNEDAQLAMFLPMYEAKVPGKRMMRISLHHDGARKSLVQQKPSTPPVEKKLTEESPTEVVSVNVKKISSKSKQVTKISSSNGPKTPMVFFPVKSKVDEATSGSETTLLGDEDVTKSPTKKPGTSQATKKTHKIPLTAAAKKCFATEEKSCIKCNTKVTMEWSIDSGGKTLCSSCTLSPNKNSLQDKFCVKCQTQNTESWHQTEGGDLFCASCMVKETENSEIEITNITQAGDPISTTEKAIELKTHEIQKVSPNEEANDLKTIEDCTTSDSSVLELDKNSSAEVAIDNGAGGDITSKEDKDDTQHRPLASGDTSELDFAAADSPPKFVISKTNETHSPETTKKGSIVDRLHEKLCFVVEEAIKGNLITEDKSGSVEENVTTTTQNKVEKNNVEKPASEQALVTKEMPTATVVLHNLNNVTEIIDKPEENYAKQNKKNKDTELEVHSSSETSSEPDTDASSSLECESLINCEEITKKKKQNNINNVVRTLQERKNSIDESNDQTNKSPNTKESNTLMLDDSSDEVPVLIIDEGENHADDHNKSLGKSDKNRRKGIPAKVYSRSSTSTESSELSSTEEHIKKSTTVREVLDEVSGQFRRSSGESNVTITLHSTDVVAPQKKNSKEIRSVNISKSLSLSVVNESSNNLEIESIENDMNDQVGIDSTIKKVNPRPTARKTLPNPPKPVELQSQKEKISGINQNKESETEIVKMCLNQTPIDPSTPPPPLINLRQTKVYTPSKVQNGGTPVAPRLIPAKPTTTHTQRADIGPANAEIDETIAKMSGQMRIMLEDMLRGVSEAGATEATVKALQIDIERLKWRHRQEIAEMKHNTDLLVMEVRASMEAEKQRALLDAKHKHELEKEQAVHETKRKQWCAFCLKEAQLYCCWNTAYCSYNCQQSHWLPHMNSCLNKQHQDNSQDTSPRGVLPRPGYNLPPGQKVRQQLMPPPANPPQYRPNQLYSATHAQPRTSFHTQLMDTHYSEAH